MKIETAKQKKDVADQAFKAGEIKDALRSYHESLMYLAGLDKNASQAMNNNARSSEDPPAKEEKTEADEIIEKIYLNMAACHMKQKNWQRTVECTDKALKKNPESFKAMFRKGKALGEQGFFDKAKKVLEELKKKNPDDAAAVDAEITRLAAIDAERTKAQNKKMKGFLSGKKIGVDLAPLPVFGEPKKDEVPKEEDVVDRPERHMKKGFFSGKDIGVKTNPPLVFGEGKSEAEKNEKDGDEDVIELTSPAARASMTT